MLSDRSYMRGEYPREKTSVLVWLICAIVAGFVVQVGVSWMRPADGALLVNELSLSDGSLRSGWIWTLLTHSFLHDPQYLFHLVINLLGLYFIGRELLPVVGSRRFIGLYAAAILTGALTWLAVHWGLAGNYYGATAGVDALLVVFACFYPHRRLDFLLFFIFPVTVKPKYVAIGVLLLELFGLFFYELREARLPIEFAVANSAHLGGMFAGWIYFRYFHDVPWQAPSDGVARELPRWIETRHQKHSRRHGAADRHEQSQRCPGGGRSHPRQDQQPRFQRAHPRRKAAPR